MSTSLTTVAFRGTRRIRLFFNGGLAPGAFTSTALYAVTNEDGNGPTPSVEAVFAVTGSPGAVELAVSLDLGSGALYQIACSSVPCSDSSHFTGSISAATPLALVDAPNVEPETQDVDLLFYGRDLVWDGNDIVEDPTGDLETISGRSNWKGAMGRRFAFSPLPWDGTYGPDAEQFVDAPEPFQLPFAGRLLSQALADDRTKRADVAVVQDPNDPGGFAFETTLVGVDALDPMTVTTPIPSSD